MSISYEEIENTLFFNTARTYTLSILEIFSNIKHYVKKEDGSAGIEEIPIQFGNYEKSVVLDDIGSKDFSNRNIIPRIVLSFEGMTKASERTLNKEHKFSMKVNMNGQNVLKHAVNSVPYDFNFRLLLQTRGMNEAFQIVEQILPKFRPSLTIQVREFPLFEETTNTQILLSDPTFEINDEMDEEDINIINVSFDITLRGNLYPPINIVAPIEVVKMFNYIIEQKDKNDIKLASKFKWNIENSMIISEESEHYPKSEIQIIKE